MIRHSFTAALLLSLLLGCGAPAGPQAVKYEAPDDYALGSAAAAAAYVDATHVDGGDAPEPDKIGKCPHCKGTGKVSDNAGSWAPCNACGGDGNIDESDLTKMIQATFDGIAGEIRELSQKAQEKLKEKVADVGSEAEPVAAAVPTPAMVSEVVAPAAPAEPVVTAEPVTPQPELPPDFPDVRKVIDWQPCEKAKELAMREGKPVLLHVTRAKGCAPCRLLETQVFPDPRVVKASQAFVCTHIDATHFWVPMLDVTSTPTDIFVRIEGPDWIVAEMNSNCPMKPELYAAYLDAMAKKLQLDR